MLRTQGDVGIVKGGLRWRKKVKVVDSWIED
jgi:hypothetical protein